MAALSRKKTVLIVLLITALGIFLPPNINGTRFKPRLAAALSAALGRQVKIGSVSFRLLPRPGFDLYDFEVADDPAFNAEPLLLCGKVTADLRLTSLWQGRLEIANLKLQNAAGRMPPSLNLVYLNGSWNVESLLARAEQVPTAPTAKKRAERRARFPYIEADAGRINFKVGPEKKPYALMDTDFAFWLAAEDVWHLRMQGRPTRTDMNLSDTGRIRIEGDLQRSRDWRQTPLQLQISWNQSQLGQLSRLTVGHDKGWRGAVDAKAELTGTLAQIHVAAQADIQDFRRYDITRGGMFTLSSRCLGEYSHGMLEFNCSLPVASGGVRMSGKFSPTSPKNYDLSVVANRVPLSAVAAFALAAKRNLPDDLMAVGEMDAAFGFHSQEDGPSDWHGTGSTSAFIVRSSAASNPIQVTAIHFHMGSRASAEVIPRLSGQARKPKPEPQRTSSLMIDPFFIQLGLGAALQLHGELGSQDYSLTVKGSAPVERILDLGNTSGFRSRLKNVTGTANLDLTVRGPWANFAPAQLIGAAHLENVSAAIPGVKEHLMLASADVHFSDAEAMLVISNPAQFEHSPVALKGSISSPVSCLSETPCPLAFDLQAASLSTQDVARLLGFGQTGWRLPFISASDTLPEFRAGGTFSADTFTAGLLALEGFKSHVEVAGRTLLLSHINAKIGDGVLEGDWSMDWTASPARNSGTGTITGVSPEHVPLPESASPLLASWISGKTNLRYSLAFQGNSAPEMLANAQVRAEFTVANGLSRAVMLEPARPTRFQQLEGRCEISHQVLELRESKFKAEKGIYEMSGTIFLAQKQAKLKVSNSATQWEITGALEKPRVAAQRLTAQQISQTQ
jgi:hypothetical protein